MSDSAEKQTPELAPAEPQTPEIEQLLSDMHEKAAFISMGGYSADHLRGCIREWAFALDALLSGGAPHGR